jgi:hypothetical protein
MLSSTLQWRHVFPRAIGGIEPIVIVFELVDSKEKEN